VLEQWTIHFRGVIPAQIAAEKFHDQYVAAFGDGDPLASYRLLDGPNETTEADSMLWSLAKRAREIGVDDVLVEYPPELALDRLRELSDGRRFLQELDVYLMRFGGRSRWHELSLPRESEHPTMTLEGLRLLLESDASPAVPRWNEELERRALASAPELGEILPTARAAYALKESHVYHIDYPGLLATREILRGFGRRLTAEGLLASADDVWMLTRAELREALTSDLTLGPVVEERRAELERGRVEGPRPYLGDPPTETERHAAVEKFYGTGGVEAAGRTLRGSAASPGSAVGIARVVAGPGDFGKVRAGDVLVATTTTPAWTPLFPSLGALVTETGGILSHAAIVAREYGLPAVVGVAGATGSVSDGARLRVDGTSGVVEIL
jgi:rifampicin phosphotransferase